MNEVIYSYFKQNYGNVNSGNHSNLVSSYKNKSIRELKKELKGLKAKKEDAIEIKFVANLCTRFTDFFACLSPRQLFLSPTWIPSFFLPKIPFDLSPPTYQQATNVIRKMRSSVSPCP